MTRRALRASVALVVPFAAACQGAEPATSSVPPPIVVSKTEETGVPPPRSFEPSAIALYHHGAVTVGMAPGLAFKAFQDLRSGGFESRDLPPGFKEPYGARSWEDGQHGFGLILYNGLVVSAMYQDGKMAMDDLYSMVKEYRNQPALSEITPRLVTGSKVNYWFWETAGQRLMICGYRSGSSEAVQVTACMGEDNVLDALGISYEEAEKDRTSIDNAPPTNPDAASVSAK